MNFEDVRSKKLHYWGTPFSLGMALVKCGTSSTDNKIELMFDTLQLEWSQHLANYIIYCLK